MSEWNTCWTNLAQCRQTKIFFPVPNLAKSKKLVNKNNRRELTDLVQWITGFNRLKRHNYLVASIDDTANKTCRLCELEDETSSHLTSDCEVLWQERVAAFQSNFLKTVPFSFTG